MKTPNQTRSSLRPARGFTLIEMSTAMIVAIVISGIMMALLQQQISFHRVMRAQNFLVEEAPQINQAVTSVLAGADAYRIHENLTDAISDTGAVLENGKTMVLGFLEADGSRTFGVISFENGANGTYLGYYNIDPSLPFVGEGNPDWVISYQVTDATFFVENGVFRMTLAGPAGETITYSGTPRL